MHHSTPRSILSLAVLAAFGSTLHAQTAPAADAAQGVTTLPTVTVTSSADASAGGLKPPFAGGQVARGGRVGLLGNQDNLDTPFSITSYTNELIQDKQARSVGDVLLNDAGIRVARGFGNFQESYFIRGFILNSDDVAYNGLYSLLPRQYIATELFERVEVLRGASTFLTGATPGGGGIGGTINLLPKRAPNEPLTRVTVGGTERSQGTVAVDIARRFGPDKATGLRFNAGYRDGGTSIDDEKSKTSVVALGLDWHNSSVRLSGDIGWQDNQLKRTRTNITLSGVTAVPALPDADANFAQPWTYSNERDLFGTLRGEFDITKDITAWAAYGLRRSDEANSLANLTVTDAATGAGNTSRFDNTRKDKVDTGEIGLRGKLTTGPVGHEWVVSASYFELEKKNAYTWDFFNTQATNLYSPTYSPLPAFTSGAFKGNELASPALTNRTKLTSVAVGDTLSLLDKTVLLTLGARHQTLRVENFAYDTGAAATPYDKSRTSPVVGAVYKLSKQLSVYANYIEGLSQGDTVAAAEGQPEKVLAPYVSKQKEVGLKYEAGRLGLGVALFSTEKPRPVQSQATAQGEDRHTGAELTAYGEATRGLRVLGGLTWLDTEQRNTGVAATEGKRTLGIPKVQSNLGLEWDVPGVEGLAVDGRVIYTGSAYADSANTLQLPSWTRLDLGVRYVTEVQGKLLTLRARVDNVANRKYWASAGGYPEQGYLVIGAPRTVGLTASVDF